MTRRQIEYQLGKYMSGQGSLGECTDDILKLHEIALSKAGKPSKKASPQVTITKPYNKEETK